MGWHSRLALATKHDKRMRGRDKR